MTQLLDKLQSATEGSRELDGQIYCAVSGLEFHMWDGAGVVVLRPDFKHIATERVRHYTTSLDAAISLVPEGWTWHVDATAPECGIDWVLLEPGLSVHAKRPKGWKGTAATPALALCIAIIKARESTKEAKLTEAQKRVVDDLV